MSERPKPATRQPGARRWLGLGFAHAGASRAWALLLLGLGLQWSYLPPGPFPWLVFVGDVPLLLLLGWGSGGRWVRWTVLYGFLHYALGFWWLGQIHPAQVLAAGIGLLPVWMTAMGALVWLSGRRVSWPLAAATVLLLEEMTRTVFMGGMPLPTRSLAFAGWPVFVRSAAFLGAYAFTFAAAYASAALAGRPRASEATPPRARLVAGGVSALVVALLLVLGSLRTDASGLRSTAPGVLLAVQGNIPQSLKHSRKGDAPNRILQTHLEVTELALASARDRGETPLAVLWPETMVPWPFVDAHLAAKFPSSESPDGVRIPSAWENEVRVIQRLEFAMRGSDAPALLGAIYRFRRGDESHEDLNRYGTHDSIFLVDPTEAWPEDIPVPDRPPPGKAPSPWIRGRHDKRVLVPGGEYTPLGEAIPLLKRIRDFVSVIPELDPGSEEQGVFVLAVPPPTGGEIRLGTAICFEILFPQRCRQLRRQGAQVLLNAANYGWFGATAFRAQIRAAAALRAAETATTVVVAGNTGPTLLYDPRGRAYGRFETGREGSPAGRPVGDDANTFREGWSAGPIVADPEPTPYVRVGDWPWLLLGFAIFLVAIARQPRRVMIP